MTELTQRWVPVLEGRVPQENWDKCAIDLEKAYGKCSNISKFARNTAVKIMKKHGYKPNV